MRYTVIYADPPWFYRDRRTSKSMGHAESAYECIPTAQLCELPVYDIAAEDSVLFMWATHPKLPEAIEVMQAWGFDYITVAFTWVKLNPLGEGYYSGLGYWTNGNCEQVLLGKRGSPRRVRKDVKQLVVAPVGRHSVKPLEVKNSIEALMGEVPRIELFARERWHNWDAIGESVDGLDIKDSLQAAIDS